MRVLVSGDAGLVVSGLVAELLRRGHTVRVATPDAAELSRRWSRVEPFDGIGGAAAGCDAIVQAGRSKLLEVLAEAERESGFRRFALVTEERVDPALFDESRLGWLIVRHSTVYGPGDPVITPLLKLVRSLPLVPVVDRGQRIRPIWYEDLAKAAIVLLERRDTARQTFAIAGSEAVTLNDLVDRLRKITARKPLRVSLPASLEKIAVSLPDESLPAPTLLRDVGIEETPLDRGLRILADSLPEKPLEEGLGRLHHKRFWADIRGSRFSPESLMAMFRGRVQEIMPTDFAAEPGAPAMLDLGNTMTLALPLRGHVQVRVERADPTAVLLVTVEGHPIAGVVEFTTRQLPGGTVRFAIDNYSRAGNAIDALALRTIGEPVQSVHWSKVVQNVIDASGGTSDGVITESRTVDDETAALVEKNVRELIEKRQREQSAPERSA